MGALLLAAVLLRATVELDPGRAERLLGVSAAVFLAGTLCWAVFVLPRLRHSAPAARVESNGQSDGMMRSTMTEVGHRARAGSRVEFARTDGYVATVPMRTNRLDTCADAPIAPGLHARAGVVCGRALGAACLMSGASA
jgi:hypothetical protein